MIDSIMTTTYHGTIYGFSRPSETVRYFHLVAAYYNERLINHSTLRAKVSTVQDKTVLCIDVIEAPFLLQYFCVFSDGRFILSNVNSISYESAVIFVESFTDKINELHGISDPFHAFHLGALSSNFTVEDRVLAVDVARYYIGY